MTGRTNSFGAGSNDLYIVKLDGTGRLQWNKTIGGTSGDEGHQIIQTADGGYAVAGQTGSDMYIVKFEASGILQWSRTLGGAGTEYGTSIIQTPDGGYAIGGTTQSFGAGIWDFYIVKLDAGGTPQWSRTVGGTIGDTPNSIIQTTDGGYALAGYTVSFGAGIADIYIVKFDASGNTCGNSTSPTSTLTTPTLTVTTPTPIATTPSPTVTTPTPTLGTGGSVTPICTAVSIQPISNEIPSQYSLYQNYPNPFNPVTTINFSIPIDSRLRGNDKVVLKVYDILGNEVATIVDEQLQRGTYEVEWNATNYPSGVYYYTITAGQYSAAKKMVLVK